MHVPLRVAVMWSRLPFWGHPKIAGKLVVIAESEKELFFFTAYSHVLSHCFRFEQSILMMQVREQASNSLHFVGSCGIGRVLDRDLRVIGFDNLKVVDASSIPDMPENSGPAGTTYMLAEYAAERIISEASHMIGNDDDDTTESADDLKDHAYDDDDDEDDGKGRTDKKAYIDDKQSERKCS
jgi:hypothetical protein